MGRRRIINLYAERKAMKKLVCLTRERNRRVIHVLCLIGEPVSVNDLRDYLEMDEWEQPKVSQALSELRRMGYVKFYQYGKQRLYFPNYEELERVSCIAKELANLEVFKMEEV